MKKNYATASPRIASGTNLNELNDPRSEHYKLLEGIRNSDKTAFGIYYEKYSKPLVGFLVRLIGNEDEAWEITQDVYIKLWERREEIEPERSVKTLIFTMAKNMALNKIKRWSINAKYETEQFYLGEDSDSSAEEKLIAEQTLEIVKEVLKELPSNQRLVFEKCRFEDKSLKEAAAELNISYETAKSYMKAALKAIRSTLPALLFFTLI